MEIEFSAEIKQKSVDMLMEVLDAKTEKGFLLIVGHIDPENKEQTIAHVALAGNEGIIRESCARAINSNIDIKKLVDSARATAWSRRQENQ